MFTEKLNKDKYNITEKFMTVKKMNLFLLALLPAVYAIYTTIYILLWDYEQIFTTLTSPRINFLLALFVLGFGIIIFIAAAIIAKAIILSKFSEGKSDSLSFKIIKEIQKPHCCLKEPVTVKQYKISLAVYIFTAGIAPYIAALILGDFMVVFACFICLVFCGGDILLFIALFKENNGSYIQDFEGIMLYRIYEKKNYNIIN